MPILDAPIALADVSDALSEPASPKPTRPSSFIERVQPWVEVFSKLATSAVFLLAFAQYYGAGQDQKRERSLQLVDQWIDGRYPDRMAAVSAHFDARVRATEKEVASIPEDLRERAWQNAENNAFAVLAEPINEQTLAVRRDIDLLLSFFAQAEICVSADLCDAEVAGAYFLVEARSIKADLEPLFSIMRAGLSPTYGKALDDFIILVRPHPK